MSRRFSPAYIARHIQRVLKDGGTTAHAEGMQRFFQEKVRARGWYTRELRRFAGSFRKVLLRERDLEFLLAVADRLFRGRVLEEKVCAVLLVQPLAATLEEEQFRLFESWLGRVSTWADHDALAYYLLGQMIAAEPRRARRVFAWARSRDHWRRRAAAVALIRGVRQGMFFPETVRVTGMLLADRDDMVQKGLGWLLREAAKADAGRTIPLLMRIRQRAPRLVLRTACETLPPGQRRMVLVSPAEAR